MLQIIHSIKVKDDPILCTQVTAALLLLCGNKLTADMRCCELWHTSGRGGHAGPFKHRMDIAGIKICLACLSAMMETIETVMLIDY